MNLTFDTLYQEAKTIFPKHCIDLHNASWLDSWAIGAACLKAIEFKDQSDKNLLLPIDENVLTYLKQMHLHDVLKEFTYNSFMGSLAQLQVTEQENLNVHEILHCDFRNTFEARLYSKIRMMFRNFGLSADDEARATALVGELGNNVFDHNDGSWPTSVRGAIILAQHYPAKQQIEVVVADPGVGFRASLKGVTPPPQSDVEAIEVGLSAGVTGRIGEVRGNGLKLLQDWTLNKYDGIVRIHSGDGLVVVDSKGRRSQTVFPIMGTLASFVARYNNK